MMRLRDCPSAKYSDKGSLNHTFRSLSYLEIYEKYFNPIRFDELNLLEIGVSRHHNPEKLVGSSLWMWNEYFPNAKIFGLDIDPVCKEYEKNGIKIYIGDQSDPNVLSKIINEARSFDIIIDDASHVNKYTLASFKALFPHLKTHGMYVIEDLGTSYAKIEEWGARKDWPGMHYNDPNQSLNNNRALMDERFRSIIYDLDHKKNDIVSLQFWSEMCFILKG